MANGLNHARHRFRFVEPAITDGQAAIREFFVNIDEAFAKAYIFHRVILRTLDRSGHDKLKGDGGSYEESILSLQAFGSYSEERALFVNCVTDGQGRRKTNHPVRINLQVIEPADIFAFQNAFVARVDNFELCFSHAGMAQISYPKHQT